MEVSGELIIIELAQRTSISKVSHKRAVVVFNNREAQVAFIEEFRKRNTQEKAPILNYNMFRRFKSHILFDKSLSDVHIDSEVNRALTI